LQTGGLFRRSKTKKSKKRGHYSQKEDREGKAQRRNQVSCKFKPKGTSF